MANDTGGIELQQPPSHRATELWLLRCFFRPNRLPIEENQGVRGRAIIACEHTVLLVFLGRDPDSWARARLLFFGSA